jgi:hypothetical protein
MVTRTVRSLLRYNLHSEGTVRDITRSCNRVNNSHVQKIKHLINKNVFISSNLKALLDIKCLTLSVILYALSMPITNCNRDVK